MLISSCSVFTIITSPIVDIFTTFSRSIRHFSSQTKREIMHNRESFCLWNALTMIIVGA